MTLNRRGFLHAIGFAAISSRAFADRPVRPQILLRSSWQTVNIGDIAHTPGVLALLEKHLPDADVRLWPSDIGNGVAEMLQRRFPMVNVVSGKDELNAAFRECDFLLHGSGPSLVAAKDVARWSSETGKPYGIFGITQVSPDAKTLSLINSAQFTFFRDSVSLQAVKEKGATCPIMEFGPDGAFAADVRDDHRAELFLKEHDLSNGQFLCCIPRLRFTPYWKIKDRPFDEVKHSRNETMKEHDHAPLREAINQIARTTSMKVLLCPEDKSQMSVGREMLFDKLPDDVRSRVVWRERYWLTDEALSTYVQSAGLFGLEMHSPIMCVGSGVPAIVGRFSEQTSKGFMWRDIGLADWLIDFDQEDEIARLVPAVLSLVTDPESAREKTQIARAFVQQRQQLMVNTLKQCLGLE